MNDTQIEPYIGHRLVSCVFKKPFFNSKRSSRALQTSKTVLLQMPILWQVSYY